MNFLAHFFLSFKVEKVLVGNLLGDFVRGKAYQDYDKQIAKGILLHRQIDTFTDQHPIVRQTNKKLYADFGKYAPVITDIFYDYFLAKNFEQFHYTDESLTEFAQYVYKTLDNNQSVLPPVLKQIARRMKEQDWLTHYGTMYGMEQSLNGLSRRAKYASHLHESLFFLQENEREIENDFLSFFPEVISFVKAQI